MVTKHKYSDNCTCQQCTDTFNKALLANIERNEKKGNKRGKAKSKNKS